MSDTALSIFCLILGGGIGHLLWRIGEELKRIKEKK